MYLLFVKSFVKDFRRTFNAVVWHIASAVGSVRTFGGECTSVKSDIELSSVVRPILSRLRFHSGVGSARFNLTIFSVKL